MSSMTGATGAGNRFKGATGGRERIPKGYEKSSMQNFTPEQMELFQQMFSQLGPDSFLSKIAGGDEAEFAKLEAPALRQFSGIQGNLASRFSGMGTGGRHSSGFQNSATQAGSDFAEQLQSRRMGLQSQALKDLHGLGNQLLGQRPYDNSLVEEQEKKVPFWQKLLGGALPIAGAGIGGFFGGPAGAALGGKLGSSAGKAFS
jgi:hypothetical protein